MPKVTAQPLDLGEKLNLTGVHLVEASAGTGKTFSIANIVLYAVLEGIPIDEVLVVTFTDAATRELRERVRANLRNFAKFLGGERSVKDAGLFEKIIRLFPEAPEELKKKIDEAVLNADQSSIFTIHGFCQRTLLENAFETKVAYGAELLEDDSNLVRELCDDFWREHFVRVDRTVSALFHNLNYDKILHLTRFLMKHFDTERTNAPGKSLQEILKDFQPFAKEAAAWRGRILSGKLEGELSALFPNPSHYKSQYSAAKMTDYLARIAKACELRSYPPPVHTGLKNYTVDLIGNSRKKTGENAGAKIPDHDFFRFCSKLLQFHSNRWHVKAAVVEQLLAYLKEKAFNLKESKGVLTFDDLLRRLEAALRNEKEKGESVLAETIRKKYRLALVDEFQDTDSVQYAIFDRVFGEAGDSRGFFMIGDPKQSIYKFRGADIFSYLEAKQNAGEWHTLTNNYRSEPGMVGAVNDLFSFKKLLMEKECPESGGNADYAFVYPPENGKSGITFDRVASKTSKSPLVVEGDAPGNMRFWLVGDPEDESLPHDRDLAIWTALEITRLMVLSQAGKAFFDGSEERRPLEYSDFAVLVDTHRQAAVLKRVFEQRAIPAVLQNTAKIFDSWEAHELRIWLEAVARPTERHVKPLLATSIVGMDAADIATLDEEELLKISNRLMEVGRRWNTEGAYALFWGFLERHGTRSRVLKRVDGERIITNYQHLAELLHEFEGSNGRDIERTIAYLDKRISEPGGDEFVERLESDASAVKIMTMHKSKGLEFNIVFCPYLWTSFIGRGSNDVFAFNEPTPKGYAKRLDLGAGEDASSANKVLFLKEALAENVRLAYVALTRAVNRCYVLLTPQTNTLRKTALAYMFSKHPPDAVVEATLKPERKADVNPGKETLANLEHIAESSGNIHFENKPFPSYKPELAPSQRRRDIAEKAPLSARKFTRSDLRAWDVGSFTGLLENHPYSTERTEEGEGIFALPRGTTFGTAVHRVFENYFSVGKDVFDAKRGTFLRGPLMLEPAFHGTKGAKLLETAGEMVDIVLNATIDADGDTIVPAEIALGDAIPEFAFFHRLARISPDRLARLFAAGSIRYDSAFTKTLGSLEFNLRRGYMKGEIDLFFRHGGKYYVLDWKTNHLGPDAECYSPENIARNMDHHLYTLQAAIYTLAAHLFLKTRMENYDYEHSFGGVAYIYVRGVDGKGNGIHFHKPPREFVEAMEVALIDEEDGE